MKTYPLLNDNGEMTAFEISNIFFPSSASVSRFFAKCPGVKFTRQRRMFERGNDLHAEFTFEGIPFVVWEPFGDNSRFWIGPDEEVHNWETGLRKLHEFVSSNWPGPLSKIVGSVVPWL